MTDLYIFNQDDHPLTIISEDSGLISAPYRLEVNKIPETPFSFTIEADTEDAKYVLEENKVVFRDHEGDLRLFVIKELDDSDSMEGPLTTATCEPEFLELAEHIVLDKRFTDKTAQVALDAAVEGTGWIGEVEVDLGLASTNFYRMRSVDAIWEIIKVWGGEFKDIVEFDEENNIVARKIKIIQRLGKDTGQRFEIDHNTTEIGRQVLSYPVTAMYGWGASLETEGGGNTRYIDFGDVEMSIANGDPFDKPKGEKWVGNPEAFARYRRIRDGVALHRFGEYSNQDIEDPRELLLATWDNLQNNNKPVVNYSLSVDLFDDKVSLGDTAIAIDRKFARPIEIQSRIIAMEYDILDIDGTMVVEMGKFLDLDDNRLEELAQEVEKIRDSPSQVTEGSFPDIKPTIPINVEALGGMGAIQLYWDYGSSIYVKHYEVYGSQLKDFVPDTQHLLWRGNTSGFLHSVGTDQVWYYRVRAVNQHGTPSDWSVQVMGATHRVISDDILFGPDIAAELRELSKTADILADGTIYADMIRQDVYDQIQADSKQYTDAEITATEVSLMSELANKAGFDYVDGKIYLVNEELLNKVDNGVYQNKILQIDNSLDGLSLRAQNVEANVNELNGEVSNALSQITAVDIKANGISTSVNELRSDFNNLEISGRNLARKSLVAPWGNTYQFDAYTYTMESMGSSGAGLRLSNTIFKPFTEYILAFKIRKISGNITTMGGHSQLSSGNPVSVYRNNELVSDVWTVGSPYPNDEEIYDYEIHFTTNGMTATDTHLYIQPNRSSGSGGYVPMKAEIWDLQVIEGNKLAGWSPPPEDIESRVSSAETKIDQTAYDLTFKASTQEVNSLTGRMTSAESSIRLLSDDIELKVDRDGIIGAINVQPGDVKIHTKLLDVGDFTNLIDNGDFEDDKVGQLPSGWINENSNTTIQVVDQTSWSGNNGSSKCLGLWASDIRNVDAQQERIIKVQEGDELYFELDYRFNNLVGPGSLSYGVRTYDLKKQHLSWTTVAYTTTKTYAWTKLTGSYKVPFGVGYIRLRVSFTNNGETTNRAWIDNLVVRRKNNAALIVDGSITANLMAANSITAQNGALANASITRAKLQDAIIGTAQIDDLAVTAAKIASVNADRINVGALRGIDVYGSKFRSSDGLTNLEIIGGNVRLTQSNGQYVNVNPDGLFGYNSGGSQRFSVDRSLVTSAALGTSNSNVYLAPDSTNEVRVVNISSIPSDGVAENYSYRPIRAQGLRFGPGYNGYIGTDREVRITSSAFTQADGSVVYRDLRASVIYGFGFSTNSINAYIGSDDETRFVNKGYVDGSSGNPVYRNARGYKGYFAGIATNTSAGGTHLYLGANGDIRATGIGMADEGSIIWRQVVAAGFQGNYIEVNPNTAGQNLFVRANNEVRATASGTTGTYIPIRAASFPTGSMASYKEDIKEWTDSALDIINRSTIYQYRLKREVESGHSRIRQGLVIGEGYQIADELIDGDGVEQYLMNSINMKGIQELDKRTRNHSDEINWLKTENQLLRNQIKVLEGKIA
ncbi:phage tail spike protein [Cytobacillus sp. FSL R5-0569]|uniref:phage tail spike protein n=1 Tax=Cytobacillus sp. FSL R5-0569 TaxID=2921649 RepID=UPI0030FCDFE4